MSLPLRPVIGFGAASLTVALVAIAGITTPATKTALHASAECPATQQTPTPVRALPEAERPA